MVKNNINKIKIELLKNEPLLGFLIYQIKLKFSEKIDTLAVYFDNEIFNFVMLINSVFFEKLDYKEQIAVLKHELYHIYFQHHSRFKKLNITNFKLANIAADISINQYIDNLPSGALKPEDFSLPKNLNFEKYYEILNSDNNINQKLQTLSKNKKKILDNHKGLTKKNNNSNEQFVDKFTKKLLKQSFEHMKEQEKIYGKKYDLNDGLKDLIRKLVLIKEKPKINIKKIMKNWIQKEIISNKFYNSWKFPNRRFNDYKGKKRIKKRKLYIAIDTSFSIKKEEINSFLNTIYNSVDLFEDEIIVLLFHTRIYFTEKLNKTSDIQKILNKIELGGTNIQQVFDFVKNKGQYLIILTDGETNYPLETFNINTLWINENINKFIVVKKRKIIKNLLS